MQRVKNRIAEQSRVKGKKIGFLKSASFLLKSLFFIVIISGVIYGIFSFTTNILSSKANCSLCDRSDEIFSSREGVVSTLYILESENGREIEHVWLNIYNRNLEKSLVVYIPRGVYVADPNNLFSTYLKISDLEYAGLLINESRAKEYAVWQIQNLTGFTVDNYVWIESFAFKKISEIVDLSSVNLKTQYESSYSNRDEVSENSLILHNVFERIGLSSIILKSSVWRSFYESLDTNIGSKDFFTSFLSNRNRLRAGGVYMIDLSQDKYINEVSDSTDSTIYTIKYSEFDRAISNNFNILRSREVEREQAKVEVYNGSGISGLALRYARRVQNFGINVVRFDNAPGEYEKTTVYISDEQKYEKSFDSTKNLVCRDCIIIKGRPEFITTGDIIIILGKDKVTEISWE